MIKCSIHKALVLLISAVFLTGIFQVNSFAQSQVISDSLVRELNKAKEDTVKVNVLIKLYEEFENKDAEKSLKYITSAMEIAANCNYALGTGKAFLYTARLYIDKGLYIEAQDNINTALSIFKELNDKKYISLCYNEFGKIKLIEGKYDEALSYYQKSLKNTEGTNEKKLISIIYTLIGNVNFSKGEYYETLKYYELSLSIATEINDKERITYCYSNIGSVNANFGNYAVALECYQKALKNCTDLKDKADYLNNIGLVHLYLGDYDKSLHYFQESTEVFIKLEDNFGLIKSYNNLGLVYSEKGEYDKAILLYHKSLNISEGLGLKEDMSISYINLGEFYSKTKDFEEAGEWFGKSLDINVETGDIHKTLFCLNELAKINIEINNPQKAILLCNRSLELAQKIGVKSGIMDVYKNLADAYKVLNNTDKALSFYKLYMVMHDSVFNENSRKQINEMEIRYETESKQQQIELQKTKLEEQEARIEKQKVLRNSLFGGMAAFFIIAILAGYAYLIKKRAAIRIAHHVEEIETQSEHLSESNIILQQQALSAQMNPHFMFNTLNSIQYFIYDNNKEESNKYLSKFSKLMRMVLDNSQQELIEIKKELDAVELYLELEALRFGNKFDYSINFEEEALNCKIPALLIQPFVENAVIHGLANKKDGKGEIHINIKLEDGSVHCTIEDNGIGRLEAIKLRKGKGVNHKSLGTKITQKRMDIANTLFGDKMNVKYIDKIGEDCKSMGTKVEITLPLMQ